MKMDNTIIIEELNNVLESIGILIDDINIDIMEYIPDSLIYISFITGIEETFNVLVPDEFLISDSVKTLSDIAGKVNDWI